MTPEPDEHVAGAGLAAVLTLLFAAFELALLGTPYAPYLATVFDAGVAHGLLRLVALAGAVCLQALFFWTMLRARTAVRVAMLLTFAAVTFVQYGYVRATGGFVTGHDFAIAIGAPMHWQAVGMHFGTAWALVPAIVLAIVLAARAPAASGGDLRRLILLASVTAVVHGAYVVPGVSGPTGRDEAAELGQPLISTQDFARASVAYAVSRNVAAWRRSTRGGRPHLGFSASAPPEHHIVLVVDEGVRPDHLSVNGYGRPTTPHLETLRRRGELRTWGAAAATTPWSDDSVLCLLTGVRNLPDTAARTLTQPTIFQFAKAMGYETRWFDGGTRGMRFGFDRHALRAIDQWETRTALGNDSETDFRIASIVAGHLTRPEGQFILVLKRGNHLPFEGNYPPGGAVWESEGGLDRLIDAYDNGIRYNVDRFMEIMLADARSRRRTTVLYTSDHGQPLRFRDLKIEGRKVFWEDVAVPMMLLGGPVARDVDTGYPAHHANVMATLLDLMDVPAAERGGTYAPSLLTARSDAAEPRPVFSGDFFGRGRWIRSDFDRLEHAER